VTVVEPTVVVWRRPWLSQVRVSLPRSVPGCFLDLGAVAVSVVAVGAAEAGRQLHLGEAAGCVVVVGRFAVAGGAGGVEGQSRVVGSVFGEGGWIGAAAVVDRFVGLGVGDFVVVADGVAVAVPVAEPVAARGEGDAAARHREVNPACCLARAQGDLGGDCFERSGLAAVVGVDDRA
jgi:hypothetical protein